MPCYHPLNAWSRLVRGKHQLFWSYAALRKRFGNDWARVVEPIQVPCGRCIGCRLERSRQWAVRCVQEASLHDDNCFITLTYDDSHLPTGGTLVRKHLQDFMKRLRSRFVDTPIRFFGCGEYGDRLKRPHYHAILFGVDLREEVPRWMNVSAIQSAAHSAYCSGSSSVLQSSSLLESLWPYGFSSVGSMTFESAAYVARYCIKKLNGPEAAKEYGEKLSPFLACSNRPGIGRGWYDKYRGDVWSIDGVFARGVLCKPPRYYEKCLATEDEQLYNVVKNKREISARSLDLTPERLAEIEECMRLKLEKVSRALD